MHNGTIEWNGSDLGRLGNPRLGISRQPDPPAPAQATRMLVNLTVTVALEALDPGTILARAQWLAAALACGEGILRVSHGSGHTLEWLALPGEHNLAEALTGTTNEVTLTFTAIENHGSGILSGLPGAVFTPAGSVTPLALHALRDQREDVRTARHTERNGARSSTTTSLSFTARVAMASMNDNLATRTSYLQGVIAAVKSLDTREGTLEFAGRSHLVRVTEFSPSMDERRSLVEVTVQCQYLTLPDAGTAEAVMERDSRVDEGSGEEVVTLSGTIEAATRDLALAKLSAIRSAQLALSGQRVVSWSSKDKVLDGHDVAASGNDWDGAMSYTLEVRRALGGGRHNLRISTRTDLRSGTTWSYTGSVTGSTAAEALALARGIAAAQSHPVLVRSEETLDTITAAAHTVGAANAFAKLDFSYEFEGASDGFVYGELNWEEARLLAGEWHRNVSGFMVAVDRSTATARMDSVLSGEPVALEKTLKWTEGYWDRSGSDETPTRTFTRLDFTATARVTRSYASVEYTDATDVDYATMTQTRDLSGTLWTDSQAHADTALAAFLTALLGGAKPLRLRSNHALVSWGSGTTSAQTGGASQWIRLEFSCATVTPVTGATGYDLLEASYTQERTGAINNSILTPIPFGRPIVQADTGYTPGHMAINASAKAVNLATAKAWVQGKRGTLGSGGHETDPPRESQSPQYPPMNGTTPTLWVFTGSYGWSFATGMDGIWG